MHKIDWKLEFLKIDLKKWIFDIFKLKDYKLKKYFFVDNYYVLGNPTNEEDFKLWLKENKKWLKDFKFYSKFFQNENFFTYYLTFAPKTK